MKIKDFDLTERPREKLLTHGADKLTDSELLAIILNTGTKEKNVLELAQGLLFENDNNLVMLYQTLQNYVLEFNHDKKSEVLKGLGAAKIAKLLAAFEIGKRVEISPYHINKTSFTDIQTVVRYYRAKLKTLPYEKFYVTLVNTRNVIIEEKEIGAGSISSVIVPIRELFKYVIQKNAAGFFLVHNHPSNNCTPSESDKELTQKIKEASKHLDIHFLDHLIVSWDNYFSFYENNLI